MADPTVRLAHRPGTIQLDQMQPEMTVSVMPVGSHLVVMWDTEQARAAYAALARLLEGDEA